jgi:hypothetical protein
MAAQVGEGDELARRASVSLKLNQGHATLLPIPLIPFWRLRKRWPAPNGSNNNSLPTSTAQSTTTNTCTCPVRVVLLPVVASDLEIVVLRWLGPRS